MLNVPADHTDVLHSAHNNLPLPIEIHPAARALHTSRRENWFPVVGILTCVTQWVPMARAVNVPP